MSSTGAEWVSAPTDEVVDAGLGDVRGRGSSVSPPLASVRDLPATSRTASPVGHDVHVVEQDQLGAGVDRLGHLVERVALDLAGQAGELRAYGRRRPR